MTSSFFQNFVICPILCLIRYIIEFITNKKPSSSFKSLPLASYYQRSEESNWLTRAPSDTLLGSAYAGNKSVRLRQLTETVKRARKNRQRVHNGCYVKKKEAVDEFMVEWKDDHQRLKQRMCSAQALPIGKTPNAASSSLEKEYAAQPLQFITTFHGGGNWNHKNIKSIFKKTHIMVQRIRPSRYM